MRQDYNQPLPWLVLACAGAVAAAVAGRRSPAPAAPAAPPGARPRLLLAALAVAATAAVTTLATLDRWPVATLLLWLAGAGLGALASRGGPATPPTRPSPPWGGGEVAILAALLALAAAARVLWIDALPRAIFGDEPRVGMYLANAYADGRIPNFFRMGWNTWPVVGLSLQGLVVPLRGLDVTALRLSSALLGTLGVLATYLLARELSGPRLAWLAAFLFAVCRTAIDFSRLGITHAQILFLEPLALLHLWRAINGGRAAHWWMAGVATGWCLFSYNAGQLVPVLVGGWLALLLLRRPARLATHWRGGALLAAGFALTVFPYAYFVTDAFHFGPNWQQFTIMARNRQTMSQVSEAWRVVGADRAWEILRRQIWVTWLGFGVLPGSGYDIGYRRGGMLDDVAAALFALGLAMALRRSARARDAFVPFWWLLTAVAGGIRYRRPARHRAHGRPAAGDRHPRRAAARLARSPPAPPGRRRSAGLAAALLLVASGGVNWRTYFVDFAATLGDPNSEMARYLASRPPNQYVLLGPEHHLALYQELFLIEFPDRVADELDVAHALPCTSRSTRR
ncbi:MAG: glycosyltransferase family 39 protein [Candidatus Binatia bacterium]